MDEPGPFGVERGRPRLEWPEHRPLHGAEVGRPPSVPGGLHVGGAADAGLSERQQIPQRIVVDEPDGGAVRPNPDEHARHSPQPGGSTRASGHRA